MIFSRKAAIALGLATVLVGPPAMGQTRAAETPTQGGLSRALEDLRNSDAEWRREDAAYRRQRGSAGLSAAETAEYAEFVAGLRRQKLENCETVRKLGGDKALAGYDCLIAAKSGGAPFAPPPPPGTAKTESEKLEGLEAELQRLEAELDEELRQKQRALRENRQNQSAGSSGGGAGSGSGQGSGEGGASGAGNTGKSGTPPKWSDPDAGKPAGAGNGEQATGAQTAGKTDETGSLPPGAPAPGPGGKAGPGAGRSAEQESNPTTAAKGGSDDGSDDDIVMRQIREAAERETDPVMKEKLWNEYRKLKAAKR